MWKRVLEASDVKEIGERVRVEDDVVVRVEDGKGSGLRMGRDQGRIQLARSDSGLGRIREGVGDGWV